MTRKVQLANEEVYHIYNRGVDGRRTFMDEQDFERFYQSLYLFNDANFDENGQGLIGRFAELQTMETTGIDVRDRFVDVITLNLMDNHFHLMLVQRKEGGISRLMHALQMGYARVFNERYERYGSLFNRPFQSVHVQNSAHFDFLPVYIHLNTLDRYSVPWRTGEVIDWEDALNKLNLHPFSGHNIALGEAQRIPVIQSKYLNSIYPTKEDYLRHLHMWSTRYASELHKLASLHGDDVTRNPYRH